MHGGWGGGGWRVTGVSLSQTPLNTRRKSRRKQKGGWWGIINLPNTDEALKGERVQACCCSYLKVQKPPPQWTKTERDQWDSRVEYTHDVDTTNTRIKSSPIKDPIFSLPHGASEVSEAPRGGGSGQTRDDANTCGIAGGVDSPCGGQRPAALLPAEEKQF